MQTLVLGASTKESRYSNRAIKLLRTKGYKVIAHGLREGKVSDVDIQTSLDGIENIHTVTLYLGSQNQVPFYDFIVNLNPERVIFNPGTENKEFQQMLDKNNIHWEEACTLVLLNIGAYGEN